ncbi:MAG: hypothetical protein AAB495_01530 [Patescibacteria group bacterium]
MGIEELPKTNVGPAGEILDIKLTKEVAARTSFNDVLVYLERKGRFRGDSDSERMGSLLNEGPRSIRTLQEVLGLVVAKHKLAGVYEDADEKDDMAMFKGRLKQEIEKAGQA